MIPLRINSLLEPVVFADDTCVIISGKNFEEVCSMARLVCNMIEWFGANKLVLNLDKTNIMKFTTINSSCSALHIGYKEN
jgi:hypothetical protein